MKLDVPDQTEPRENPQDVVGHIHFPPIDALAFGVRIAVVIVMPALAHSNDRKNETIFAFLAGIEPLLADQMGQGIDAKGAVIKEGRAGEESPTKHLDTIGVETGSCMLEEDPEKEDTGG